MVLKLLAAIVLITGCSQSLFDAGKGPGPGSGDDGGDDGVVVPSQCPSPCLGDAATDFDGTPTGKDSRWLYVADNRNRTWTGMQPDGDGLAGGGGTAITTCAAAPDAPACAALAGSLLVTGTGAGGAADPAIAFPVRNAAVLQLTLKVRRDDGGSDPVPVRLYRNSREDAILTASAYSGTTLEKTLTVPALANDRFYVAIDGAVDRAAVQYFVNDSGTSFPGTCQVAMTFDQALPTGIDNLCGTDATSFHYNETGADNEVAPVLVGGPFAELGQAADLAPTLYYKAASALDRSIDNTVQFWLKLDNPPPVGNGAWVFSDMGYFEAGGSAVVLFDDNDGRGLQIVVQSNTDPAPVFAEAAASYPADKAWHLLRMVQKVSGTSTTMSVCVDGVLKTSYPIPAGGKLVSETGPYMGMNGLWTPRGAFTDGQLDDVRAFATALPCE
jgi:hypothetical protein